MKNITIIGSTGSIGESALEVLRHLPEFKVIALAANRNISRFIEQVEEFNPHTLSIGTQEGYELLRQRFPDKKIYLGDEGLKALGALDETDIILTAVSGAIGIQATIEAIKKEKRIALANKETMVAAGPLILKLLKEYPNAEIIPVDSEHSALFQSLSSGKKEEVKSLILTASGGPFRGKDTQFLKNVTVAQALKHPNWSMGSKITIDSATLVNKGLEVIEAHFLFQIPFDQIQVVVHPESIIHSMVEFNDHSIIAQCGVPDMKLPIQYAFTYPERLYSPTLPALNFSAIQALHFQSPDLKTFKGLALAFTAGKKGGNAMAVYNAANEVAVELFLAEKISFLTIYDIIETSLNTLPWYELNSLEEVFTSDSATRQFVRERWGK